MLLLVMLVTIGTSGRVIWIGWLGVVEHHIRSTSDIFAAMEGGGRRIAKLSVTSVSRLVLTYVLHLSVLPVDVMYCVLLVLQVLAWGLGSH